MIYRKRGVIERWENGARVRVSESGVALEEGEVFRCHPERREGSPPFSPSWGSFGVFAPQDDSVRIERLILTRGIGEHEYGGRTWRDETERGVAVEEGEVFRCHPERSEGSPPFSTSWGSFGVFTPQDDSVRIERAEHEYGGRTWRDETERIHAALVKGRMRALVDAFADLEPAARLLARAGERERPAPPRLRLAPNVTAALIPNLIDLAPPNIELRQTAGRIDGYGEPVADVPVAQAANWYRPSYRLRPMKMPIDVRIECAVTEIERDRPIAAALLAPPDGLTLRVLIDDGTDVYPATVRVARIDAVARERFWYPYGAGSFGAEMML